MKYIYLCLGILLFLSCAEESGSKSKKTIVTGLPPIASIIERISGEQYRTLSLISSTVDPHYFSLKPSDAVVLADADLVIALDKHFDGEALSSYPHKDRFFLLNDSMNETHGQENNPHLWMSFRYTMVLADKICSILIKMFPEDKDIFLSNRVLLGDQIQENYEYALKLSTQKEIFIIQRHHLWDYLLEELGVPIIDTLESYEGEQVSFKKTARILAKLEPLDPQKVLIIEDELSVPSSVLQKIADERDIEIQQWNPMKTEKGSHDIVDLLNDYGTKLFR